MATSRIKLSNRSELSSQRQEGRQKLLFANRKIISSDDSSTMAMDQFKASSLSIDQIVDSFQTFKKPNNSECFRALKRLNLLFFDAPNLSVQQKYIDLFFPDGGNDRIIHNLAGIFTNSNFEDNRVQVEAGLCLSNLCATKNSKQEIILSRLTMPYFVSYLIDGVETTRISMALVSLQALSNLIPESKTNPKLFEFVISQNVLETVGAIIMHTDKEIRQRAFSVLESILRLSHDPNLKIAIDRLLKFQPNFISNMYQILNSFEINTEEDRSIIQSCARSMFHLSIFDGDYLFFVKDQKLTINTILIAIEKGSDDGEWKLNLLFPLLRTIGNILGKNNVGAIFDQGTASLFLQLISKFLASPYVPLKKETLWVLSNFVSENGFYQFLINTEENQKLFLQVIAKIANIGILSLDKEIIRLCARIYYNTFYFSNDLYLQEEVKNQVYNDIRRFYDRTANFGGVNIWIIAGADGEIIDENLYLMYGALNNLLS
jgi:hypothetical protein